MARRRSDTLEVVDVGIGIIGFFAFAFLVITIVCELTGTDALGWALTLLAFVLVFGALVMTRQRIAASRRAEDQTSQTNLE